MIISNDIFFTVMKHFDYDYGRRGGVGLVVIVQTFNSYNVNSNSADSSFLFAIISCAKIIKDEAMVQLLAPCNN